VINGPIVSKDDSGQAVQLNRDDLGILSDGDAISIRAGEHDAHFLLISGKPLKEPIARGGPFVMNTQAEIQQAFDDYRHGRF
jgi:redox-sensitive bicupin YhaK (pirin superfamily)